MNGILQTAVFSQAYFTRLLTKELRRARLIDGETFGDIVMPVMVYLAAQLGATGATLYFADNEEGVLRPLYVSHSPGSTEEQIVTLFTQVDDICLKSERTVSGFMGATINERIFWLRELGEKGESLHNHPVSYGYLDMWNIENVGEEIPHSWKSRITRFSNAKLVPVSMLLASYRHPDDNALVIQFIRDYKPAEPRPAPFTKDQHAVLMLPFLALALAITALEHQACR